MEGEAVDFQDWELLHKSEDDAPLMDSANFAGVGVETDGGVLRHDYFSIDGPNKYSTNVSGEGDGTEEGSVESDNPSWVDPTLETSQYKRNNSSEFWSDSSSDRSEERKTHLDVTSELALAEMMKGRAVSEGIGEMEAKGKNFAKLESFDLNVTMESNPFNNPKSEDSGKVDFLDKSLENCFYDSGGVDLESHNNVKNVETSKSSDGLNGDMDSVKSIQEECPVENKSIQVSEVKSDLTPSVGGGEKRRIVWWKVPFEVIRYCVFKVSPVWSISMAAAFMGFIILGRRLYKMKRKSQSLKLNVTMDDKKVPQFMSRAARLNEAFSVVRRVPVIRPALPAPGMTPWVVMSMR